MPLNQVIPVAPKVERQNRPGVVPAVSGGRTSQILSLVIPTLKSIQLFQAGQQFYLVLATGTVKIKPNNGSENTYTQGKGQIVPPDNQFSSLQLTNPNPFDIVVQIFVGFGDYIDNTVILYNPQISSVVYPTLSAVSTVNNLLIPDLSGSAFNDLNGTQWLAISRIALVVSNYDTGLTYNIVNTANNKVVFGVFPATNITLPWSGNFRITNGANLNMIVSELYYAILPGTT